MRHILLIIAALVMVACGGKQPSEKPVTTTEELPMDAGTVPFVRINVDSTLMLWSIRDNEEEHRMPNRLFYGDGDSAEVEMLSPQGSVPSSVSCFVAVKDSRRILFDAGRGSDNGGVAIERLKAIGMPPDSIDYIMITHMHMDHIGGLMADGKPVFRRAEVYVSQEEVAHWTSGADSDSPYRQLLNAYSGRIHTFSDGEQLPLGVVAMAAPGHTPGHTVYQLGRLLVVGDLVHGLALQMNDPQICAKYDMNRPKAIDSRNHILNYAEQNQLLMAGMHMPYNATLDFLVIGGEQPADN